jgi:nucleotide-binding universal stress UspA family protein
MKPFQKILVPTDFSPVVDNSLQVAADLSRRYEAPITLLHVWEPEIFSVPSGQQLFDPSQRLRLIAHYNGLLEQARHVLKSAGVLEVATVVAEGAPVNTIVDFAKTGAFDLIVMGTHGRTGLGHALLGSVAERVARMAPCSVLTTRGR